MFVLAHFACARVKDMMTDEKRMKLLPLVYVASKPPQKGRFRRVEMKRENEMLEHLTRVGRDHAQCFSLLARDGEEKSQKDFDPRLYKSLTERGDELPYAGLV
jgi:hypothetical protein